MTSEYNPKDVKKNQITVNALRRLRPLADNPRDLHLEAYHLIGEGEIHASTTREDIAHLIRAWDPAQYATDYPIERNAQDLERARARGVAAAEALICFGLDSSGRWWSIGGPGTRIMVSSYEVLGYHALSGAFLEGLLSALPDTAILEDNRPAGIKCFSVPFDAGPIPYWRRGERAQRPIAADYDPSPVCDRCRARA